MTTDPARIATAHQLLTQLGVTLADLQDNPAQHVRVPTMAEYLPQVVAAAGRGGETAGAAGRWPRRDGAGMAQAEPGTTAGVAGEKAPAATGWRDPRVRRAVQAALSLLIVGGIFWFVLGQFADLSSVWDAIRSLTWREVAVLVALAVPPALERRERALSQPSSVQPARHFGHLVCPGTNTPSSPTWCRESSPPTACRVQKPTTPPVSSRRA